MVKCADCGYLSVRNKADYGLGEASIDFRERGAVPVKTDDQGRNQNPVHELIPLCFARQSYLRDAIKNIDKKTNQNDQVRNITQTGHNCKEFINWQQGFTPKEHRETEQEEKKRKSDRTWRYIELALTLIVGAFIALVSASISKG